MARRKSKSGRSNRTASGGGGAPSVPKPRPEIVSWRGNMTGLMQGLRDWSRTSYGEAIDAFLAQHLPAEAAPADLETATDDYVCSAGSAGDGSSILRVYADHATDLDDEARGQIRRWENERRRGVFVVQRARRDRLFLWDPLEGAQLTLHMLDKLPAARMQSIGRGTVTTAVFQPWMARLIAVRVEFFCDPQALQLFREETTGSGTTWHEAPAPAPERSRGD